MMLASIAPGQAAQANLTWARSRSRIQPSAPAPGARGCPQPSCCTCLTDFHCEYSWRSFWPRSYTRWTRFWPGLHCQLYMPGFLLLLGTVWLLVNINSWLLVNLWSTHWLRAGLRDVIYSFVQVNTRMPANIPAIDQIITNNRFQMIKNNYYQIITNDQYQTIII